jgi:hypothetical protein
LTEQADKTGSVTATITSVSCSTVEACTVTGFSTTATTTTSASAAPTAPYMISPNQDQSYGVLQALTIRLKKELTQAVRAVSILIPHSA